MLKKKVERQVQRFPIWLALHELNGQPAPDSYLVDISSLGAQLESPLSVRVNAAVEFVVYFPWTDKATRLAGQVKWIRLVESKPERFRFGLRFFQAFWELDTLARQGKLQVDLSPAS